MGGGAGRGVVVSGGLCHGAAAAGEDRHRVRPALVPALGGDPMAARRRSRRGRLHAARTLIGDHDVRHIRAPHGRGRTRGAGESRLADGAGGDLGTPFITQADRAAWQQAAAAQLAALLAAPPDRPVIAWTLTASGGSLSGPVLIPPAPSRLLFHARRHAPGP